MASREYIDAAIAVLEMGPVRIFTDPTQLHSLCRFLRLTTRQT